MSEACICENLLFVVDIRSSFFNILGLGFLAVAGGRGQASIMGIEAEDIDIDGISTLVRHCR